MPELPEVETIVRRLRAGTSEEPSILGRRILAMEARWPRHIAEPAAGTACRLAAGRTIEDISRRGKFLVMRLDRGWMLLHLRMSGDLCVFPSDTPAEKHDITIWRLSGGLDLRFHDPRRFGRVWLVEDPAAVLAPLGPEPLEKDFTAKKLAAMLRARRRRLKPLLLDQTFIAGLGNIYTDEALHLARLHPLRRSDALRADETERLWRAIRTTLRAGIARDGASIDWVYRGGRYQHAFRAYGRSGEPCRVCGTAIRRIIVGQRSTFFCPHCQRKPRTAHG